MSVSRELKRQARRYEPCLPRPVKVPPGEDECEDHSRITGSLCNRRHLSLLARILSRPEISLRAASSSSLVHVWADLAAGIDCVPIHVTAVRWKPAHMAQRKFQRLRDLVAVVRLDCQRRHLGRLAVPRRFPPACSIDETNNACFIVRDSTGQALGYFYFEQEPRRFSGQAAYPRRTQSERYERRAFANHELINRPRKRGGCG